MTQHKLPAVLAGEEVIKQRSSSAANMQVTGWAGRETSAHRSHKNLENTFGEV